MKPTIIPALFLLLLLNVFSCISLTPESVDVEISKNEIDSIELVQVSHPYLGGRVARATLDPDLIDRFLIDFSDKKQGLWKFYSCYVIKIHFKNGSLVSYRTNGTLFNKIKGDSTFLGSFQLKENMVSTYWGIRPTDFCKKDTLCEQLIFGTFFGQCMGTCATMYRYKVDGFRKTFSADYTDSYFNGGNLVFATELNDTSYISLATNIARNIPQSFLSSSDTVQRFGCPDCTDGGGIYFEMIKNGQKKKFYMDYETSKLTGEAKLFATYLKTQIADIKRLKK